MKLTGAFVMLTLLSVPALAQEHREPSASGAGPVVQKQDGSAATALPELDATPGKTVERPNSDASRKAEDMVRKEK